ncbi:MAG: hypothetical protein WD016_11260 [Balneolaceae bacterium]
MKKISLVFFFGLCFFTANAQSLQVSRDASTQGNSTSQFLVGEGEQISITNSSLKFDPDAVSADVSESGLSASVDASGISVFDGNGSELIDTRYDMISDDSSLKIYATWNGSFIVRDNIANFSMYNSFGNIDYSVSNSSQSTEGESISELAADPAFRTVVLFNPKIVRNGQEGSRARYIKNGKAIDFFSSQNRAIRSVHVSENGQFIGIVTYNAGTEDEVSITDRFGNELSKIPFDQTITDVRFSDDGRFVTLRSNSRVAAHSVVTGERVGSTSFRSTLHFAKYIPEDETIIALTGDKSGSVLTNVEVHAINVSERAIEREELNFSLGVTDLIPLKLTREGRFSYTFSGFNQKLKVNASF